MLFADGLKDIVTPGTKVHKVAGGCKFTEGPAYGPNRTLIFSDIPNNRIVRVLPDGGSENFLKPTGKSNGLMFNRAGILYACQGGDRRVVRIDVENGKKITPVADSYNGKKLNSPNDLVLDAHGGIYFTDPRYGSQDDVEQPVMGVYYINSKGVISRVIDDLERPNGISVSPRGNYLYVADFDPGKIYRYTIQSPGNLTKKGRHLQ